MGEIAFVRRVEEAASHVRRELRLAEGSAPVLGVVLGSGLGVIVDTLKETRSIPFREIPHFPTPSVEGHAGKLVLARLGDGHVLFLQGRVHYYEGLPLTEVTFPIRVLGRLGVKGLVLTNAVGGIARDLRPGDLMVIEDHVNFMGANPLRGPEALAFGPRFPDMTAAYDREFNEIFEGTAASLGLRLRRGVLAAMPGPSYETPAEIRMLGIIGAHAVGMSVVPEVLVARQMGMRVAAVSCVTNLAAGIGAAPLRHDEVMETANRVRADFVALIERAIPSLVRTVGRSG